MRAPHFRARPGCLMRLLGGGPVPVSVEGAADMSDNFQVLGELFFLTLDSLLMPPVGS